MFRLDRIYLGLMCVIFEIETYYKSERKRKGSNKSAFIDFENAYYNINKGKLGKIVSKKEIFCNENLNFFLGFMIIFLFGSIEKKKNLLENGLFQGSLLAL